MSKTKNYNRALYESIEADLRAVISPHKIIQAGGILDSVYTSEAREEAMTFLCMNDIPHTFTYVPINSKLRARVVMLAWTEPDGAEKNLAWWEKNASIE